MALEPADVVRCRECGGLVRRVNEQHLETDRCKYGSVEARRHGDPRPDHPDTVQGYKEKHPDAPVMSPREKRKLASANEDPEVTERRKELMRRRWRGDSMSRIVESLANRYGVEESTIWADFRDRENWIRRVFGLVDAESAVVEALAQKEQIRSELRNIASRAKNQNELRAATAALKEVNSSLDKDVEHRREVAEAATPDQTEVSGEVTVTHRTDPGSDLDEETLENLDRLTGGAGEEIVDAEFAEVEPDGDGDG